MGTNPRVRELLAIWDQAPANAKPSAAELCASDPQLFPEIERHIRARLTSAAHTTAAPPPPPPAQQTKHGISVSAIEGYRLVRELGRGGQAVVYEAVQKSTTRRVAIKVLTAGRFAGPQERRRLEREAQVLAALNHPNVVQVIDRGVTNEGFYYLVMEYVVGRPVNEWLDRRHRHRPVNEPSATDVATAESPLPGPDQSLPLFLKICSAVNAAHLRGIVHRDLKPGNILVDDAGEPHVLDFGLARAGLPDTAGVDGPSAQPITITGQFLGSLPWASPEQAEGIGSQIDTRSDVYSLGVILYQLLTGGHFPYKVVGTMREVLDNILRADPVPPSKVLAPAPKGRRHRHFGSARLPQVNPAIEAIVLKALSKRREDRYQTAGELAREIENYLAGRPILAASPSRGPSRARRIVAAWVAISVVLVAAMVGTWLVPGARHARQAGRPDRVSGGADAEQPISAPTPAPPSSALTDARHAAGETEAPRVTVATTQPFPLEPAETVKATDPPAPTTLKSIELAATQPADPPRRDYVHPGGRTVELLPLINPSLDAAPWASDKWSTVEGELVAATQGGGNLRVPYTPPAAYDYVIEFTRKGGPDSVGMILPHPTKPESFRWIMGGTGNQRFGLTKVNGLTADEGTNPTRIERKPALQDARRYKAVVQVRQDRVRAYLDGELLCDFQTDYANLSDPYPTGASELGLLTFGCAAVFHRVAVIEVEGYGKPLRASATTAPSDYVPPEGTVVELLPLVNLRADVHQLGPPGPEPVLRNGELHMPGTRGVVELPYFPPDEYDFLVEFTRTAGTRQVIQDCPHPLGHGHVNWTLNMGFGKVDGKMPHEPANPTHVRRERGAFTNNVRHQSVVQLRRGEIRAYFDGRLVSAYRTDYRDITQPGPRRDPSRLGVYSEHNDIVFHRAAVTEVDGTGEMLRGVPKSGTTRPSGYVQPPGKVVDLLAKLRRGADPAAEAQKWQLRAAGMVIAPTEQARDIVLPYHPTGGYDYLIEFTQRSGNIGFNQQFYLEEHGRHMTWHVNGPAGECALFSGPAAETLRVVLPAPLKPGTRHVSVVQVRPNDFRAYLDGQLVFRRRPLPGVTFGVNAPPGGRGALGVHVGKCEITIHRAAVLEVVEPADTSAAAKRAAGAIKPGANAKRNADR